MLGERMMTARQAKIFEYRLYREKLKRAADSSLYEYTRQAWSMVEPSREFVDGWHIGAICAHLEAVSKLQIRNLIINVPPRHMKSLLVNVFWPTWEWGPNNKPHLEWIFGAYSPKLSIRDAVKARRVLESSWYHSLWAERFTPDYDRKDLFRRKGTLLAEDQNSKESYRNIHSGSRIATSPGGVGTGSNADIFCFDDPHKVGRLSDTERLKAINWIADEMSTRGNDPATFRRVGIMQRVHAMDATAYLIENQPGQWDHLVLPFEYEPKIIVDLKAKTALNFVDPRTKLGERLWDRYDGETGDRIKDSLKPAQRSGQLQQSPTPKEGVVFKAPWFTPRWTELPPRFDYLITCWDMTFGTGEDEEDPTKTARNAYDVGYALGWFRGKYYVVDEIRERLEPHMQEVKTKGLKAKWAHMGCRTILIEDAANGRATAKKIKRLVSGVILVTPEGTKEDRADAVTSVFMAGDVLFPADGVTPWAEDAVAEFISFGSKARYKDRVDALVHGIEHLEPKVSRKAAVTGAPPTSMEKQSLWSQV